MNKKDLLAYKIGGLLYTPALNTNIADRIIQKKYDCLTSVAFCLEDSIEDGALHIAETALCDTLFKPNLSKKVSNKITKSQEKPCFL